MHAAGPRILGAPRSARVASDDGGVPRSLDGRPVATVRDEWRVEEGWWTGRPVQRRYFDVVLADGRNAILFCERRTGRWFTQRG
ncbi:MAG TPA: hypothetical protein VHI30_11605 [Gaiellales bacterium]|nr:hypothetical protein [Gaiellales bacterium]